MLKLKKMGIAMLASVMLAGALSAASLADTVDSKTLFVIVGEGASPLPTTPPFTTDVDNTALLDNN